VGGAGRRVDHPDERDAGFAVFSQLLFKLFDTVFRRDDFRDEVFERLQFDFGYITLTVDGSSIRIHAKKFPNEFGHPSVVDAILVITLEVLIVDRQAGRQGHLLHHRLRKWRQVDLGTGRDQLANDDVLFEAEEAVYLAAYRSLGEDTRRLLEGGGGEEALGVQRGLGDAE
jgi:hypothetical protein